MLIAFVAGLVIGSFAGAASWLVGAVVAETQRMSGARMVGVGRPQMAGAAAWTPAEAELAGYGAELNADEEQSAITLRSRRLDSPSPVFGNRRARTKRNVAPARPGVQAAVTGKERL